MNKTLRKYRFGSKGAFTKKLNALPHDEDGNPTHGHLIVELGHPIEVEATEETEAVHSNDYCVDVLWDGAPDEDWDNQLVWSMIPQHMMGGVRCHKEYQRAMFEAHPEWVPVVEVEEDTDPLDIV